MGLLNALLGLGHVLVNPSAGVRAIAISSQASRFQVHYGYLGSIAQVHLALQTAGCPANELVDLYIAANCKADELCHFIYRLHRWWIEEDADALDDLLHWSVEAKVGVFDKHGLVPMLRRIKSEKEAAVNESQAQKELDDRQEHYLALAIEASRQAEEMSRRTPLLLTPADAHTFGEDLVDLCKRIAKSAIALGHGVKAYPVTERDEEMFGEDVIDLMRRATREAHEQEHSADAPTPRITTKDSDTFGQDMVEFLWRVAFEELHILREESPESVESEDKPDFLQPKGFRPPSPEVKQALRNPQELLRQYARSGKESLPSNRAPVPSTGLTNYDHTPESREALAKALEKEALPANAKSVESFASEPGGDRAKGAGS